MFTQTVEAARPRALPSSEAAQTQPKRWPLLVRLISLLCLCFTVFIATVVTAARAEPTPQLPEIPQAYMPGSPVPRDGWCYWPDQQAPRCPVQFGDDDVYLSFDAPAGIIIRTFVPTRAYTIGDLINAWGNPTGIRQKYTLTHVFWESRSALLFTPFLRPESRVEFILYDSEAQVTLPWRGFRWRNN